MEASARVLLLRLFRDMPDPRMVGKVSHKLHDILVITVCAVLCGLEHWTRIEDFGKAHEAWFRTFLELPNGIPSHDTFGKVSAAPDPDAFEQRIQLWIHALLGSPTRGKHIAIDGKTLRRSFDRASGQAAIHMINAYVHENHAVFGQLKVDDKTNEITAIPSLLHQCSFGPTGTKAGRPDPQSLACGKRTALDAGCQLQRGPMPRAYC